MARFSSIFNLVITLGGYPTPHVGMWRTWKKQLLPMWASILVLFKVHHSTSDPTRMWHGSLFEQLPNTQRRGLPFLTNTQNTKEKKIKIKTHKNNIEKAKRGGKKNQQEKIEINKIFKNYRKIKEKNKKQERKDPKIFIKKLFQIK